MTFREDAVIVTMTQPMTFCTLRMLEDYSGESNASVRLASR